MPTGYTHSIEKGISFNDFVLQCSRAMGALIMMRDEPHDAEIPDRFEPSDYHIKEIAKTESDLKELKSLNEKEIQNRIEDEYKEAVEDKEKYIREKHNLKDKYEKMLLSVKAWKPPTSEHQGLKKFMIEQINSSINFDCNTEYYQKVEKQNPENWLSDKINKALKDLDYHKKEYAADFERTEARNLWIKQLRESLS